MSVTVPPAGGVDIGLSFYHGETINPMRATSDLRADPPRGGGVETAFRRDRLTWIAYGLLAWFAYLQAAPGLLVGHLRDEFWLSYSTGGLHIAAFAAGALVAGLVSGSIERAIGRRALFWASAGLMGLGAV